jgi:hypothetical protein
MPILLSRRYYYPLFGNKKIKEVRGYTAQGLIAKMERAGVVRPLLFKPH